MALTSRVPALSAFDTPAFRRLFVITFLGTFAQGAIFTSLGWVIVEETGSPVLVSLVITTFLAPQIFAGPLGGATADRFGRALVLRLGMGVRAVLTILLALSVLIEPGAVWALLILNVVSATISGGTVPARRALTADVVPKKNLTSAISMEEFGITFGFLTAPFLTGVLLTVISAEIVLFGVAVSFLLAALLVPFGLPGIGQDSDAKSGEAATHPSHGILGVFKDGLTYAWQNPTVRSLLIVGFVGELLAFNYFSLIPIFTTQVFDGGAGLLGSLQGTVSLGESLGVLVLAWIGTRIVKAGRWFLIGVGAVHLAAIPLGLSTVLPLTFILLVLVGGGAALFGVLQSRVIIEAVPQNSRARLLGVQQMTWAGGALGGFIAGTLAEVFSPGPVVASMAAVGLALVIIVALVSSQLRNVTTTFQSELFEPPVSPPTQ
ncbi:MAG: MFS transporter [Chloroflexi bacterium]|nr:MFS transporter [Chloroflexota bacterium]